MAEENQDGQEKTEEPSQRKIDKHKEDGKVLSSKEMFVFTGIAGALLLMYAFSFSFKALLFEWGDLFFSLEMINLMIYQRQSLYGTFLHFKNKLTSRHPHVDHRFGYTICRWWYQFCSKGPLF